MPKGIGRSSSIRVWGVKNLEKVKFHPVANINASVARCVPLSSVTLLACTLDICVR